jgi:hypothetical protein
MTCEEVNELLTSLRPRSCEQDSDCRRSVRSCEILGAGVLAGLFDGLEAWHHDRCRDGNVIVCCRSAHPLVCMDRRCTDLGW